jgi:hypothetical protein
MQSLSGGSRTLIGLVSAIKRACISQAYRSAAQSPFNAPLYEAFPKLLHCTGHGQIPIRGGLVCTRHTLRHRLPKPQAIHSKLLLCSLLVWVSGIDGHSKS